MKIKIQKNSNARAKLIKGKIINLEREIGALDRDRTFFINKKAKIKAQIDQLKTHRFFYLIQLL